MERKNKEPNRDNPGKTQPDVLNELKAMRSDMALLKTLSAEVAQIKESIRQPSPVAVQIPSPPLMQEYTPSPQFPAAISKPLASPRARSERSHGTIPTRVCKTAILSPIATGATEKMCWLSTKQCRVLYSLLQMWK